MLYRYKIEQKYDIHVSQIVSDKELANSADKPTFTVTGNKCEDPWIHVGLPGFTGDNSIGDYNRMPVLYPLFQAPPHWNVNMQGEPGIFSRDQDIFEKGSEFTCKGYDFYILQ